MTRLYCTPAHRLAARRLRRAAHEDKAARAKTAAPSRHQRRGQAPGPSRHRRHLTAGVVLVTSATLLAGTAMALTQAVYSTPRQPAKHAHTPPLATRQLADTQGTGTPKTPLPSPPANAPLSPLATTMEQLSGVQTALKTLLAHNPKTQTPSVLALIRSEAALLQHARSLEHPDAIEQARHELAGKLAATGKELNATDTAGHVLSQATSDGPSPDLAATEHDLESHKRVLTGKAGVLHGAISLLSTPLHSVVPALTGTGEPAGHQPGQSPTKHAPHPNDPPTALAPSGTKRNDPPVKTTRTERPPVLSDPPHRTAPPSPSRTTTPAPARPSTKPSPPPTTNASTTTDLATQISNYTHTAIQQHMHTTPPTATPARTTTNATDLGTQISNYTHTMIQQQIHNMIDNTQ